MHLFCHFSFKDDKNLALWEELQQPLLSHEVNTGKVGIKDGETR